MNESIVKYMQVGLVHFMAFPETMKGEGPIYETLKKIVLDDYFSAVEITTIRDPQVRKDVTDMLNSSHMTVAYGAQPRLLTKGLNVNDLDESKRKAAVDEVKESIDEAVEIGASALAFLSGPYEESRKKEAFEALLKSTDEICTYAERRGKLDLSLEIFDYDVDKKSLVGPANLALQYAKEVRKKHKDFGLMVDLSHIPLIHETVEQSILPVRDYITHAHMGNCVIKAPDLPGYGDVHPRFGFPDSENDVEEVVYYLNVLGEIGFLNENDPPIVSFEIKPFEGEDSDVVIANAKRVLNAAWARCNIHSPKLSIQD